MLDFVLVMRHVECQIACVNGRLVDDPLSIAAEQRARGVAEWIHGVIGTRSAKMLTSTARRCVETSLAMNAVLEYDYFETALLNGNTTEFRDRLERIFFRESTYGAFLLVTHQAFVRTSFEFVVENQRLRYAYDRVPIDYPYGGVLVIDARRKEVRLVTGSEGTFQLAG